VRYYLGLGIAGTSAGGDTPDARDPFLSEAAIEFFDVGDWAVHGYLIFFPANHCRAAVASASLERMGKI
jgi:hypothetical protein